MFVTGIFFYIKVMAVEVSDTVPVVAFGYPVPLFHNRCADKLVF